MYLYNGAKNKQFSLSNSCLALNYLETKITFGYPQICILLNTTELKDRN